ncbi:MAG: hypothetical protein ABIJ37_02220 [Pseudomonadota bacterium]
MTIIKFKIVMISLLILVVGGCTALQSRLEMDYGNSFKQAKSNQKLNTCRSKDLTPVRGFDGQTAQIVTEKYRKSFAKPTQEETAYTMRSKSISE